MTWTRCFACVGHSIHVVSVIPARSFQCCEAAVKRGLFRASETRGRGDGKTWGRGDAGRWEDAERAVVPNSPQRDVGATAIAPLSRNHSFNPDDVAKRLSAIVGEENVSASPRPPVPASGFLPVSSSP